MKSKRIISALLAAVTAVTMTACGNSGSGEPTKKDFEKAAEKLDNMTDEDFEKAAEKAFGEDEPTVDPTKNKETFEPCQEILDADFTSGLIQIGDDIFKCGGYLTVSDLVNQYGDRYNFDDVDLSKKLAAEETEGSIIFKNKTNDIEIKALYCKHGNTLGEAVAYDIAENGAPYRTFFPKGIKGNDTLETMDEDIVKQKASDFFNTYFGTNNILTKQDIYKENIYELQENEEYWYLNCIKSCSAYNGNHNIIYYDSKELGMPVYYFGAIETLESDNLFGFKPITSFIIIFEKGYNTMRVDYKQYNLYDDKTIYPTNPRAV